jgi:ArsR family transcriptional regulator, arsenate/arsenite/antimonite-responsive transcriptional repressor
MERDEAAVGRFAGRFAAIGNEARQRILRLLLAAHPEGLVVGDVQAELGMPGSTLSHHLEKLKQQELVDIRREGTFLRCRANTAALQEVLNFLCAECGTRNRAIPPENLVLQIERNPSWTSKK